MNIARILFILVLLGGPTGLLQAEPDLISVGPFGGDVRSLAVHPEEPERVFLGTADGQIYRSQDGGQTWSKLQPGIGRRELVIDSLVFHPQDPEILWAGGWELKSDRGALYRTTDAGSRWQRIDLGFYESSIRSVAVSPVDPLLVAVGINEGVLVTRDGGENWERINRGYRSLHHVHSLAFHPRERETLYVGTWRLAWKTEDLGGKWIPIHDGMFWDSDLFSIQIDPQNPSRVFAGACSGAYRSGNAGEQWAKMKNGLPSAAKRTRAVRIDPFDSRTVYAGTTIGLYRSRDGGDSWQSLLSDLVINAILIDPRTPDTVIVATDDAGVLRSVDGGRTFQTSNDGFTQRQVATVATQRGQEELYFAGVALDAEHGGFFLSRDQGRNWLRFNEGLGEVVSGLRVILPSPENGKVFLGSVSGVYQGIPEQRAWSRIDSTQGMVINALAEAPGNPSELLVAARSGLYRLDLAAAQLSEVVIPVYRNREVFSILSDPKSGDLWIGTEMGVFHSSDRGETWQIRVNGLPYTVVNTVRKTESTLLAGTRAGLYVSVDGGEHWRQAEGVFPIDIVSIQPGEGSETVYASDPLVGYLFVSRDSGRTWSALDVGRSVSRIVSMASTPGGDVVAGTIAEGVFRIIPVEDNPSSESTSSTAGSR